MRHFCFCACGRSARVLAHGGKHADSSDEDEGIPAGISGTKRPPAPPPPTFSRSARCRALALALALALVLAQALALNLALTLSRALTLIYKQRVQRPGWAHDSLPLPPAAATHDHASAYA